MTSFLMGQRTRGGSGNIYDFVRFSHFSLTEIFPALASGGTAAGQAMSQFLAILVTLAFALVGGLVTGQFSILISCYPFCS